MKYLILGMLFLALPYVLLSNFVVPALESLEDIYRNADSIAERAVNE